MGSLPPTTNALASPIALHRHGGKPVDLSIRDVILGDISFGTWYPSFYPEELIGREVDRLFVCQWCFKYTGDAAAFLAHRRHCPYRNGPLPGKPIYERGMHAIYEIDGEEHQLFAQNLSLFAKLFLDNKSIFYDVTSFKYYLLVYTSTLHVTPSSQIVGFFSKEKMSWDNNNLACILVFPPWQRKGLGKILMGVSYELSRRENRIGGPEKPLSESGRKGYMRFWTARVTKVMLGLKNKSSISLAELASECSMLPEDTLAVLKDMEVVGVKRKTNGVVPISKSRIKDFLDKNKVDLNPPVDEEGFLEGFMSEEMEDEV